MSTIKKTDGTFTDDFLKVHLFDWVTIYRPRTTFTGEQLLAMLSQFRKEEQKLLAGEESKTDWPTIELQTRKEN